MKFISLLVFSILGIYIDNCDAGGSVTVTFKGETRKTVLFGGDDDDECMSCSGGIKRNFDFFVFKLTFIKIFHCSHNKNFMAKNCPFTFDWNSIVELITENVFELFVLVQVAAMVVVVMDHTLVDVAQIQVDVVPILVDATRVANAKLQKLDRASVHRKQQLKNINERRYSTYQPYR